MCCFSWSHVHLSVQQGWPSRNIDQNHCIWFTVKLQNCHPWNVLIPKQSGSVGSVTSSWGTVFFAKSSKHAFLSVLGTMTLQDFRCCCGLSLAGCLCFKQVLPSFVSSRHWTHIQRTQWTPFKKCFKRRVWERKLECQEIRTSKRPVNFEPFGLLLFAEEESCGMQAKGACERGSWSVDSTSKHQNVHQTLNLQFSFVVLLDFMILKFERRSLERVVLAMQITPCVLMFG